MNGKNNKHFVYIVRCADGTLYTGYTLDLEARINAHNAGRGAKYPRARRPVELLYTETYSSKSQALKREHEIKAKSRDVKLALISANFDT